MLTRTEINNNHFWILIFFTILDWQVQFLAFFKPVQTLSVLFLREIDWPLMYPLEIRYNLLKVA